MAKSKTPAAANGKAAGPLSPLDVLTLAEAAAYLRLPEDAVREEADAGRLVGRHVRGEWRFSRESVVAWLNVPRPADPPRTGAELVERICRINEQFGFQESPEEAEEFIRKVYSRRKADSAAG